MQAKNFLSISKRWFLIDKKLIIMFNEQLVDEYKKHYFQKYPRRKKCDIKPTCISLNEFIGKMNRQMQAASKNKYKEFVLWALNYYNIPKLKLSECTLNIKLHWHDKRRRDYDNALLVKFYNDAIVEYGLLQDDNTSIIKKLTFEADYIKASQSSVEFIFCY